MKGKDEEHNKNDSNDVASHNMDPIPFDLTFEILTRLPVKSLIRFQYVSKTWSSVIRSRNFIKSDAMSSSTLSPRLLISFKNGKLTNKNAAKSLFFFTASSQEEEASSSLVANLDMTMSSMDAYYYVRCASVNGFICLSHNGQFMLCNPSTTQVITLPKIAGGADWNWNSTCKYLGYDPVDDQYKAMCKKVSSSKEDQEHMVLSLGGDQKPSWRRIEGTTRDYCPLTKGICINGFVYYGAWTPIRFMDRVIVCFDVRSEKLSFIELPSRNGIDWEGTSALIDYKGKLANVNVHLSRDGVYYEFDIWVLEDDQWSINSCSFLRSWWDYLGEIPMSIQGANKTGEILITPKFLPRGGGPFYILYFNTKSKCVRKVQLEGVANDEDFRHRYGIEKNGNCHVFISPEYVPNYTFLL